MTIEQIATELFNLMGERPRKAAENWFGEFNRGELFLLTYLYKNGGSAWPSTMSKALQTSTARITVALNNLEHKGWIAREFDENDGRRKIVHLTPEGTEYIAGHINIARKNVILLLEKLGEEDAAEYLRIVKKMELISRDINFNLR